MHPTDQKLLQALLYQDAVEFEEHDLKVSYKRQLRWLAAEKEALTDLKAIERNPNYQL